MVMLHLANLCRFLLFPGTTCATVLTRAIFAEGCKSVAAGMNPMDLRRGISMAVDNVVMNLKSRARMISTSEEIAQVSQVVDLEIPFLVRKYHKNLNTGLICDLIIFR